MPDKTLYLVDGSSIMYRSFYALKLSTSSGFPSGAVYGFSNTLRKLAQKYRPTYLCICFDVSRKTFRQEKFKEYKIQRPPAPDALKLQVPLVKDVARYLGAVIMEKEGYEADDIIASLTESALKEKFSVVIITSDKDMFQLITPGKVSVYAPFKDKLYDYDTFVAEFGFKPPYIIDYLSLVGDASDNIPGAKGIGKVGAAKLIQEYSTVENIFKNLGTFPPKIKKTLENSKDAVLLSKELILLHSALRITVTPDALMLKEPDYESLFALYKKLEFKSLLKSLPQSHGKEAVDIHQGLPHSTRTTIEKNKEMVAYCTEHDCFIYDTAQKVIHKESVTKVKALLSDESIKKISYGCKDQIHALGAAVPLKGIQFDAAIAAYVVDPALGDYSLENICAHFLADFSREIRKDHYPSRICQLHTVLSQKIKENALDALFFEVEMPLITVLADMEKEGVNIDAAALDGLIEEVCAEIEKTKSEIYRIAKTDFNLNSPKQLRQVLFEDLKLPPQKRTKTGFSTDEEVLRKLSIQFPIARHLLEYRALNKLHSTYLAPFARQVKEQNGKIHASFIQTATQTGRLSSRSPNLQNIPIKSDYARTVRKVFIPSAAKGIILSSDYSQIELRILAHFSREPALCDAFKAGRDIHAATASLLFEAREDEISKAQREIAKRVNFGIIYGMSSWGLARELGILEEEARSFISNYFSRYAKVKEFIDTTVKTAKKQGYVRTLMGRIRYLPDLQSGNSDVREFARRQAINTPIQGTAADLIKIAMIKIHKILKENKLATRLIMQIHDELVFDVQHKELEKVVDIVRVNMENSINLNVPIIANLKTGKNWLELKPL